MVLIDIYLLAAKIKSLKDLTFIRFLFKKILNYFFIKLSFSYKLSSTSWNPPPIISSATVSYVSTFTFYVNSLIPILKFLPNLRIFFFGIISSIEMIYCLYSSRCISSFLSLKSLSRLSNIYLILMIFVFIRLYSSDN